MKKLILMGAVFMGLYANALNLKFTAENPLCHGAATGSIDLMVLGGAQPYTYTWSNGASAASISGLVAGSYTVTVNDNVGAIAISTISIADPAAIQITPTVIDVTSAGGNDGGIFLTVRGGTPDYSYAWSNGASSRNLLNLTAGTYTVSVTDVNGCQGSSTSTVSENSNLTPVNGNPYGSSQMVMGTNDNDKTAAATIYPNPASTLLKVRVPEGGPSEYSIFNANGEEVLKNKFTAETGADVSILPAGNYVVKVKSQQGISSKNIVIAK